VFIRDPTLIISKSHVLNVKFLALALRLSSWLWLWP